MTQPAVTDAVEAPHEPEDLDLIRTHEATKVEEILRLEREIQALQRQKERQELSLTEASLNRLQLLRDQELRRLEDEACRAAQQFLDSLNFDEIDECVRNIESSLGAGDQAGTEKEFGRRRRSHEEEVDEGFGADEEAFKDSPNPSEHGHSDGQRTSGIRTSDDSSEEDPYANEGAAPPLLPAALPPPPPAPEEAEAPVELIPPDEDSDYDQDDYDEGAIVAVPHPRGDHWSPDYRGSAGTYGGSGAYRFSSEGAQSSVRARCRLQPPPGGSDLTSPSLSSSSSRTARTTRSGWTRRTSCRPGGTRSTAASPCPTSTASCTSKVRPSVRPSAGAHLPGAHASPQPLLPRGPDEHLEAALVRPQGRDLPVVPGQAGGPEAGLAAQEGRRLVHAVAPQLETPLVRAAPEQAHVLRERQ